jgi:hypothetical protein
MRPCIMDDTRRHGMQIAYIILGEKNNIKKYWLWRNFRGIVCLVKVQLKKQQFRFQRQGKQAKGYLFVTTPP